MVNPKILVINLKLSLLHQLFTILRCTQSCESRVWFLNATAGSTGLLIRNTEHYLESFADGQGSVGEWAARTAGIHGNSLGVSICSRCNNYEQTAVTTTSAEESAGQTTISVTDASVFGVGDIVNFGETNGRIRSNICK